MSPEGSVNKTEGRGTPGWEWGRWGGVSQFTLSLSFSIPSPKESPEKPLGIRKRSLGTMQKLLH